jgi:hypothetical protein
MSNYYARGAALAVAAFCCPFLFSQDAVPPGAKVFIAPMNGYESFIKTAIGKKKVPIVVVELRDDADFEMSGAAETQKAGAAKILLTGSWHSTEDATIKLTNLKTSVVAFAYSVHKSDSAHGKQSSAEACAKHAIEKKAR